MTSELARFVGIFVRATSASRVLEIGTGSGACARAIADALPSNGMLITLERDHVRAVAARQAFAATGQADRITVMSGDASRYLHKIAGPFHLVLQDGDVTQYTTLHDRLVGLLAPAGTLITHNLKHGGSYNEVLARDERLNTVPLAIGEGLALSVLRKQP